MLATTRAPMFGTLGRMTPKAGKRATELVGLLSRPPTEEEAKRYRGAYLWRAEDGDDVVVAVMYDEDAYFAMVHVPRPTRTSARSCRSWRRSRRGPTGSGSVRSDGTRLVRRPVGER
jgi:hypothetical protein